MDKLEIFDKNGNALDIADVIYSFIKDRADKHNKDIEDVYIGFDNSHWNKHKAPSIYTVEITCNSNDGKDVISFGHDDVLKVNVCKLV